MVGFDRVVYYIYRERKRCRLIVVYGGRERKRLDGWDCFWSWKEKFLVYLFYGEIWGVRDFYIKWVNLLCLFIVVGFKVKNGLILKYVI